jgi:hypothetical protein
MKTLQQILDSVLVAGLYDDGRAIYPERFRPYFSKTGSWQQPEELAALLHYLQDYPIQSFLEIGTFQGRTFKVIADFLTELNPQVRCCTVDPIVHSDRLEDPRYTYILGTAEAVAHDSFDLVLIDGDHATNSVRSDFERVGRQAKICVFHDIEDQFIAADYPGGGAPRVWADLRRELAQTHAVIEFIAPDKPTRNMGIGVLIKL